jgi:hypothetical protein
MALEDYYEPFFVQKLEEQPSPYPPPWTPPQKYVDEREIQGMFKQQQSSEVNVAAAMGISSVGRFACSSSEQFASGTVLRRVKDGLLISLIGTPMTAPLQAETQVSTWSAKMITEGDDAEPEDEWIGGGQEWIDCS